MYVNKIKETKKRIKVSMKNFADNSLFYMLFDNDLMIYLQKP